MPIDKICKECGTKFSVIPARVNAVYCCKACQSKAQSKISGPNHPRWQGGERTKVCGHCKTEFHWDKHPLDVWKKQKFCCKPCADKGGLRHEGENHPNWKPETRRKQRRGKHGSWADKVMSRDNGTCQVCSSKEQLQAHHIKSYADHPESRWDVENGLTVCFTCHLKIHSAANENSVNSGEALPDTEKSGGNPEPSSERKLLEGVTTRGRAYRRYEGHCEWCSTFISKPWSDVHGKAHLFCSRTCSGKYAAAHRTYRQWVNPESPTAVISSKSAGRESDDIV